MHKVSIIDTLVFNQMENSRHLGENIFEEEIQNKNKLKIGYYWQLKYIHHFFHLPWVLSPDDHWDIYGLSLGQNIDVYEIDSQSLDGIVVLDEYRQNISWKFYGYFLAGVPYHERDYDVLC